MAADPAAVAALRQRLEDSGQLAALKATLRAALAHAAAVPGSSTTTEGGPALLLSSSLHISEHGASPPPPPPPPNSAARAHPPDAHTRASAALVLDFLAVCGLPATRAALLAEWRGLGASALPSRGGLAAVLGLPPPVSTHPEGGGPSGPHTALLTQLVGVRMLAPAPSEAAAPAPAAAAAAAAGAPVHKRAVPAPAPPRAGPLQPPPLSPPASPPRQRPDAQAYPRSPVAVPASGRMLLAQLSAPLEPPVAAPLQPPPPPRRAYAAVVATLPPVSDDADDEAEAEEDGGGVGNDAASAGEAPLRDEEMSPSTAMILSTFTAAQQQRQQQQQQPSAPGGSPAVPHVANSLSPETGSLRQLRAHKPARDGRDGASAFQPVVAIAAAAAAATAAPPTLSISRTLGLGSELGRLAARYVGAAASPTGLGAGGDDADAGGAAPVRRGGLHEARDAPPPPAWQPQLPQPLAAARSPAAVPAPVVTGGAPPSPNSRWDAHWGRGIAAADGTARGSGGGMDAGLADEEEGDTGTSNAAAAAAAALATASSGGSALDSELEAALAGVAVGPRRAETRLPPPRAAAHQVPAAGAAPNTGAVPTPPALSPASTARVVAIRTHATELVASAARAVAASTAAGAATRAPLAGRALGGRETLAFDASALLASLRVEGGSVGAPQPRPRAGGEPHRAGEAAGGGVMSPQAAARYRQYVGAYGGEVAGDDAEGVDAAAPARPLPSSLQLPMAGGGGGGKGDVYDYEL